MNLPDEWLTYTEHHRIYGFISKFYETESLMAKELNPTLLILNTKPGIIEMSFPLI